MDSAGHSLAGGQLNAQCSVVRMQLVGKRIKRNMRKRVGLGWWTRLFTRSVTVTKRDPLLPIYW